jgi:hypothetical protein
LNLAAPTRLLEKDEDLAHASPLVRRLERLYIGREMVAAMLQLAEQSQEDPHTAATAFASKRRRWERDGGFIEAVSVEEATEWIQSDSYVLAQASAPGSSCFHPVAQAVLKLPRDRWVVPLLTYARDMVHSPSIHDRILADGYRATAMVDFLGVLPEWSHTRLAGSARRAGIMELIRRNRFLPREHQIRQLMGLSFAVQRLEILDSAHRKRFGRFVELTELGQEEIVNRASMSAIGRSLRSPAHLLGQWRSAPPVEVCLDGRSYLLHVQWSCFVRLIEEVAGANP